MSLRYSLARDPAQRLSNCFGSTPIMGQLHFLVGFHQDHKMATSSTKTTCFLIHTLGVRVTSTSPPGFAMIVLLCFNPSFGTNRFRLEIITVPVGMI